MTKIVANTSSIKEINKKIILLNKKDIKLNMSSKYLSDFAISFNKLADDVQEKISSISKYLSDYCNKIDDFSSKMNTNINEININSSRFDKVSSFAANTFSTTKVNGFENLTSDDITSIRSIADNAYSSLSDNLNTNDLKSLLSYSLAIYKNYGDGLTEMEMAELLSGKNIQTIISDIYKGGNTTRAINLSIEYGVNFSGLAEAISTLEESKKNGNSASIENFNAKIDEKISALKNIQSNVFASTMNSILDSNNFLQQQNKNLENEIKISAYTQNGFTYEEAKYIVGDNTIFSNYNNTGLMFFNENKRLTEVCENIISNQERYQKYIEDQMAIENGFKSLDEITENIEKANNDINKYTEELEYLNNSSIAFDTIRNLIYDKNISKSDLDNCIVGYTYKDSNGNVIFLSVTDVMGNINDYTPVSFKELCGGTEEYDKIINLLGSDTKKINEFFNDLDKNIDDKITSTELNIKTLKATIEELSLFKENIEMCADIVINSNSSDFDSKSVFNLDNLNIITEISNKDKNKVELTEKSDALSFISLMINGEGNIEYNLNHNPYITIDGKKVYVTLSDELLNNFGNFVRFMTDEQKAMFNYKLTISEDEAYAYLNYIYERDITGKGSLLTQWKNYEDQCVQNICDEVVDKCGTVLGNTLITLASFSASLSGNARRLIKTVEANSDENGSLDAFDMYNSGEAYTSYVSNQLEGKYIISTDNVQWGSFSKVYEISKSVAENMTLGALTGGASWANAISTVLYYGVNSFGSTMNESVERGLDLDDATLYSLLCATTETLTEYVNLESLTNISSIMANLSKGVSTKIATETGSTFLTKSSAWVIGTLFQGFCEGSEEVTSTIAGYGWDYLINGENSKNNIAYLDYLTQGYSEEEARKLVINNCFNEVKESFEIGAISGGISAGISLTFSMNEMQNSNEYKTIKDNFNVSDAQAFAAVLTISNIINEEDNEEKRDEKIQKVMENLAIISIGNMAVTSASEIVQNTITNQNASDVVETLDEVEDVKVSTEQISTIDEKKVEKTYNPSSAYDNLISNNSLFDLGLTELESKFIEAQTRYNNGEITVNEFENVAHDYFTKMKESLIENMINIDDPLTQLRYLYLQIGMNFSYQNDADGILPSTYKESQYEKDDLNFNNLTKNTLVCKEMCLLYMDILNTLNEKYNGNFNFEIQGVEGKHRWLSVEVEVNGEIKYLCVDLTAGVGTDLNDVHDVALIKAGLNTFGFQILDEVPTNTIKNMKDKISSESDSLIKSIDEKLGYTKKGNSISDKIIKKIYGKYNNAKKGSLSFKTLFEENFFEDLNGYEIYMVLKEIKANLLNKKGENLLNNSQLHLYAYFNRDTNMIETVVVDIEELFIYSKSDGLKTFDNNNEMLEYFEKNNILFIKSGNDYNKDNIIKLRNMYYEYGNYSDDFSITKTQSSNYNKFLENSITFGLDYYIDYFVNDISFEKLLNYLENNDINSFKDSKIEELINGSIDFLGGIGLDNFNDFLNNNLITIIKEMYNSYLNRSTSGVILKGKTPAYWQEQIDIIKKYCQENNISFESGDNVETLDNAEKNETNIEQQQNKELTETPIQKTPKSIWKIENQDFIETIDEIEVLDDNTIITGDETTEELETKIKSIKESSGYLSLDFLENKTEEEIIEYLNSNINLINDLYKCKYIEDFINNQITKGFSGILHISKILNNLSAENISVSLLETFKNLSSIDIRNFLLLIRNNDILIEQTIMLENFISFFEKDMLNLSLLNEERQRLVIDKIELNIDSYSNFNSVIKENRVDELLLIEKINNSALTDEQIIAMINKDPTKNIFLALYNKLDLNKLKNSYYGLFSKMIEFEISIFDTELADKFVEYIKSNDLNDFYYTYFLNNFMSYYNITDYSSLISNHNCIEIITKIKKFLNKNFMDENKCSLISNWFSNNYDLFKNLTTDLLSNYNKDIYSQEEIESLIQILDIYSLLDNSKYLMNQIKTLDKSSTEYQKTLDKINQIKNDYANISKYYDAIFKSLIESDITIDDNLYSILLVNFSTSYARSLNLDTSFIMYYKDNGEGGYSLQNEHAIYFNSKYKGNNRELFHNPTLINYENPILSDLEIVFHEVTHQLQDVATDINTYRLKEIIDKTIRSKYEKYYNNNYYYISYEVDARVKSVSKLRKYLSKISPETLEVYDRAFKENFKQETNNYKYNKGNLYNSDTKKIVLMDVLMDEIMFEKTSKNKLNDYFKENPILTIIYNNDGTRKSALDLMLRLQNETDVEVIQIIKDRLAYATYNIDGIINEIQILLSHETDNKQLLNLIYDVANDLINNKLKQTLLCENIDEKNINEIFNRVSNILEKTNLSDETISAYKEYINLIKIYYHEKMIEMIFNNIDNDSLIDESYFNIIKELLKDDSKKDLIIDYINKNILDYDVYKVVRNIPELINILCYQTENFNKTIQLNLEINNIEYIFDTIFSNMTQENIEKCLSLDSLKKFTPEQREQLEEKYPGIIKNIGLLSKEERYTYEERYNEILDILKSKQYKNYIYLLNNGYDVSNFEIKDMYDSLIAEKNQIEQIMIDNDISLDSIINTSNLNFEESENIRNTLEYQNFSEIDESIFDNLDLENTDIKVGDKLYSTYQIMDMIKKGKELKQTILDKVSGYTDVIQKIRAAYIELNKLLHYKKEWYDYDTEHKNQEFDKDINFTSIIEDNNVICGTWSNLFIDLLYEMNLPVESISIKGPHYAHEWIEVKLGDGNIIIADATEGIYQLDKYYSTDLVCCKYGSPTSGFMILPESFSGTRLSSLLKSIFDLETYKKNYEIENDAQKEWEDFSNYMLHYLQNSYNEVKKVDVLINYATNDGKYYKDSIDFANNVFAGNGKNLTENEKINNLINLTIPDTMNEAEAKKYLRRMLSLYGIKNEVYSERFIHDGIVYDGYYMLINNKVMFINKDSNVGNLLFDSITDYSSFTITVEHSDTAELDPYTRKRITAKLDITSKTANMLETEENAKNLEMIDEVENLFDTSEEL